ncbi:hypothetical protein F4Z99_12720 [Candidatus Poribacteria bacterium]|nr:hypothetical protein [Candidatus Poribacteria bacterium]MYB02514.1 hypothetical protein [Candidatus Poribacteria bacterium]
MATKQNYQFTRFSEDRNTYLISIRQQKVIPAHGSKFHFKYRRHQPGLLESWWHLLPGAYYLFEYSKSKKQYTLHKVLIKESEKDFIEEHQLVEYIPDWLQQLLSKLPEYEEDKFNAEHAIYSTSRRVHPTRNKGDDRKVLA